MRGIARYSHSWFGWASRFLETLRTCRVRVGGDWEFIHSNNSSPEIPREREREEEDNREARKVPTFLRALK